LTNPISKAIAKAIGWNILAAAGHAVALVLTVGVGNVIIGVA